MTCLARHRPLVCRSAGLSGYHCKNNGVCVSACSKECQLEHWKVHRHVCPRLQQGGLIKVPATALSPRVTPGHPPDLDLRSLLCGLPSRFSVTLFRRPGEFDPLSAVRVNCNGLDVDLEVRRCCEVIACHDHMQARSQNTTSPYSVSLSSWLSASQPLACSTLLAARNDAV